MLSLRPAAVTVLVMVSIAWGGKAHAQQMQANTGQDRWMLGVSAGLWGVAASSDTRDDPRDLALALDVSVQRRLSPASQAGARAIRVQVGKGYAGRAGRPDFGYTRLLAGFVRNLVSASDLPFTVYVAAGGGAAAVRSPLERGTKVSVYGSIGWDMKPRSSPLSLAAEYQLHSIGSRVCGTASLAARLHFP